MSSMGTGAAPDDLKGLGALADPARRGLYEFVAGQREPVTRETAASGTGMSRTLAAYHLDKLAEAGLLDVSYARKDGRTGPGSGRPAKQYTRARQELAVSLPPRNYRLLAHILAGAAADAADGALSAALTTAAERAGSELGEQVHQLPEALTIAGYEPETTDDGDLFLRNCPFDRVVAEHTELVCSLNHAVIRGALIGTGEDPERAELAPCDGRCCVVIHPAGARARTPE